jgi:hypothetical protein
MKSSYFAKSCICCDSEKLSLSPAVLMPFITKRIFGIEPIEITEEWGMRHLKVGTSYFPTNTVECQNCGSLFLELRFDREQMDNLYKDYRGEIYTIQRDFYEPGYSSGAATDYKHRHPYISDIESWLSPKLPKKPTILDWGGGDGLNSPFLGIGDIFIFDISGVEIEEGAKKIDSNQIFNQKYDLISCLQVFEHVSYPIDLLSEMVNVMSKNTLLYIEVPFENLMHEKSGAQGFGREKLYWHEHINFFSEMGLNLLCKRAGLDIIEIHHQQFKNGVRSGEVIGILSRLNTD